MPWVLTAGAVGALRIWDGDVPAPTSEICCSRVLGQPGRAAPSTGHQHNSPGPRFTAGFPHVP